MTLLELYRELESGHPDFTDTQMAMAILARLSRQPDWPDILFPLVRADLVRWRRDAVRDQEQLVYGEDTEPGVDPAAAHKALLRQGMYVPGKGLVRWGEATVADHRARIAMLRRLRDGLDRTISAHEAAIRAIQAAGVRCLDDIRQTA